jgi:hypothetical protein
VESFFNFSSYFIFVLFIYSRLLLFAFCSSSSYPSFVSLSCYSITPSILLHLLLSLAHLDPHDCVCRVSGGQKKLLYRSVESRQKQRNAAAEHAPPPPKTLNIKPYWVRDLQEPLVDTAIFVMILINSVAHIKAGYITPWKTGTDSLTNNVLTSLASRAIKLAQNI